MTVSSVSGLAVAVTGGTGALGARLIDALLRSGAREIRVLSRDPNRAPVWPAVRYVAGDIREGLGLAELLVGVDGVFHLAAMKRIDECEAQPIEAVRTNVIGSVHLIRSALASPKIQWVIAASSVSACAPAGVYGLTKALVEHLTSAAADRSSGPAFAAVRLPSLYDAPGAVLDRWRRSAGVGGAIPVTEPEMTRFALSVEGAIALLLAAAERPPRSAIVVPAAPAYRLGDLAAAFAAAHAARIEIVGRRPGEKQHEDLISHAEAPFAHATDAGYVISREAAGQGVAPASSRDARRLGAEELRQLVRPDRVLA